MSFSSTSWPRMVDGFAACTHFISLIWSISIFIVPWGRSEKKGKIKLKETDHGEHYTKKDELRAKLLEQVALNLTNDGEPVQVASFWRKTLIARCCLVFFTLTSIGIQVYATVNDHLNFSDPLALISSSSEGVISIYLLCLTLAYAFNSNVTRHKRLTYHIFSLSSIVLFHRYLQTIVESILPEYQSSIHTEWIRYTFLGIAACQILIAGNIPVSPELYTDLKDVYSQAVKNALREDPTIDEEHRLKGNVIKAQTSSIFSQWLFTFAFGTIFSNAAKDQVDIVDLPTGEADIRTQNILDQVMHSKYNLIARWRNHKTWSILYTVWWPQRAPVLKAFILSLICCPLWYIPHVCLQHILSILDDPGSPRKGAAAFASLMVLATFGSKILNMQQYTFQQAYAGPRISAHTSFLLFQKVLTRNLFASNDKEDGTNAVQTKADILNLISSDAAAVQKIGWTFSELFRAILELAVGCVYIWVLLGPSGMWGFATFIFTCPPAYFLTKWEYQVFEKRLAIRDERVSLMQEAIQAISMIKMMATERFWFKRISEVRKREFQKLTSATLIGFASSLLYSAAPTILIIVSFAHYTLIAKQQLTATIAFTSIAVFDELRVALFNLPVTVAALLQNILGAKRIATFLTTEDVQYLSEPAGVDANDEEESLYIRGTVAWDQPKVYDATQPASSSGTSTPSSNTVGFRLQDLDVHFPRGQFSLVAGKFGSGKSLLLLALLGEAQLVEGKLAYAVSPLMNPTALDDKDWSLIKRAVAYVPQTPWLLSQSIRDNILFGLPLNEDRYRSVCFATGLMPDLELLEDGDLTEIGERGKILSGGQKARVSLARAVYSRGSTMLLDDVISAVDAQTSKHIVEHCFKSPLMAGRTVIIASHAIESLAPLAQHSIFLDDGKCIFTGTGLDLLDSEHMSHLKTESRLPSRVPSRRPSITGMPEEFTNMAKDIATNSVHEADDKNEVSEKSMEQAKNFQVKESVAKTPRQLILEEQRSSGSVDLQHWKNLFKLNGGKFYWSTLISIIVISVLLPVASRSVLSLWTGKGTTQDRNSDDIVVFWVVLYAVLSITQVTLLTGWAVQMFFGGMRAMRLTHDQMLESMLRSKMIFFTKTRAGSIVQRFGKDLANSFTGVLTLSSV
ncbi:uncharacterized protein I303_108257 [Kwoniella dejecticola CBS 10117]|uniref:ABC transporter ABCC.6 n=1 Tax=Kwoniella dejecticola CBS 10117 TaxID=1296121 RepID=A0AAJ8KWA7_9TREE